MPQYIKVKLPSMETEESIKKLYSEIMTCDAIVIGAGAGLSASAGFCYSGERFERYFSDFEDKYGFNDMYSGGFYQYASSEEYWAYWSRYIYVNRYMDPPKPVYSMLYSLVKDKDYFVLTTNVDHCFQKAGFKKERLFYTQGDYGLFQCSGPCRNRIYGNLEIVREMLISQGYAFDPEGHLMVPGDKAFKDEYYSKGVPEYKGGSGCGEPAYAGNVSGERRASSLKMRVPSGLIPRCPCCGKPMTMNLRADESFAEDEGWHEAAKRYKEFIRGHKGMHILYLELGVGYNTPGIIKFPFWQMTAENRHAVYACLNLNEAFIPEGLEDRSVCINGDIAGIIEKCCSTAQIPGCA